MPTQREEALWDLLDDIDTASDRFRPDNNHPFTQYVMAKCQERHKHLRSDGFKLQEPNE